jgi:hypothetical protein
MISFVGPEYGWSSSMIVCWQFLTCGVTRIEGKKGEKRRKERNVLMYIIDNSHSATVSIISQQNKGKTREKRGENNGMLAIGINEDNNGEHLPVVLQQLLEYQ